MAEVRVAADPPRRLTTVVTVAALTAMVGIAYRLDRAYARWLTEISPLTKPRARLGQLKTGYRERCADMADLALIIFGVLGEVARVRSEQAQAKVHGRLVEEQHALRESPVTGQA
jgi:hypothetical protein